MKRGRIALVGIAFILMMTISIGFASSVDKPISGNYRFGANVTIGQSEVIPEGLLTAAANIDVLGTVKKGLQAFGANIQIQGNIEGDLTVMGANVVLSGKFMNKVKAGAANIILSGTFENGVDIGAARIVIAPTAVIKGDLLYAAPT